MGKQQDAPAPAWQRGHRGHGFWFGDHVRFGYVTIGLGRVSKTGGYHWSFSPPGEPEVEGDVDTLRQGKRAVERAYREKVAAGWCWDPAVLQAWK